jgi:hypothetical protein
MHLSLYFNLSFKNDFKAVFQMAMILVYKDLKNVIFFDGIDFSLCFTCVKLEFQGKYRTDKSKLLSIDFCFKCSYNNVKLFAIICSLYCNWLTDIQNWVYETRRKYGWKADFGYILLLHKTLIARL